MEEKEKNEDKTITCGLVMPISAIDGNSSEHWTEVKNILTEAIEGIKETSFKVTLVSDSDDSGIIQKRIVQNLYSSDIVVCDVSAKNPNVMFELGMRLAFDKPAIIVKDDKTDYSFDTSIIEHLQYPRDLRFSKIVTFKNLLADKVIGTYKAAANDKNHSTFLKSFGEFKVASLTESVVPADVLILEMISDLQSEIKKLNRSQSLDKGETSNVDAFNDYIWKNEKDIVREYIDIYVEAMLKNNPNMTMIDVISRNYFHNEIINKFNIRHFVNAKEFEQMVTNIFITKKGNPLDNLSKKPKKT